MFDFMFAHSAQVIYLFKVVLVCFHLSIIICLKNKKACVSCAFRAMNNEITEALFGRKVLIIVDSSKEYVLT